MRATVLLADGAHDGNGTTIMHLRDWQGWLRDFRSDWRLWSRAERVAAGLLIVATAALPVLFHP